MNSNGENNSGFLTLKELVDLSTSAAPIVVIPESKGMKDYFNLNANNNPIALDLRLGDEVFLSSKEVPSKINDDMESKYISIKPGEFALLTTYEKLCLPEFIVGFISMRFSYKIKGLINVSGFHVDPGYRGKIIYSVYNAGPNRIVLEYKEKIFTIIFSKISIPSRRDPQVFNDIEHIQPKHIAEIMGTPVSPQNLEKRIQTLEIWNKLTLGISSGLVIAVLAALLGK